MIRDSCAGEKGFADAGACRKCHSLFLCKRAAFLYISRLLFAYFNSGGLIRGRIEKWGYHLWSERYDREMADIFAIQDEIAQAIAGAAGGRRRTRSGLAGDA